jgi:hypothetical protein
MHAEQALCHWATPSVLLFFCCLWSYVKSPFIFLFNFLLSYYCFTGSSFWHLQKCLQYILAKFTHSIILLDHPPSSVLRIVSADLIFLFSFDYHNHPPILFPYIFLSPSSTNPQIVPDLRSCSLFKIAIQRVSVWHFHVYTYYNQNWFSPCIFLISTIILF